jgi:hypothetical protein
LGNTINWKLPTISSDSFASPLITQNASLGPYPAAIREELRQEVVFQGAVRGFRRHFSIWTVQDSPLSKGTLGVDQNGLVYTVDRIVNRKRIDELPQTLCVIEP